MTDLFYIMKSKFVICFLLFITHISLEGQTFELTIKVANYDKDTLLIGRFHGRGQKILDTLVRQGKGVFIWKQDVMPPSGIYLAYTKPDPNAIQFVINGREAKFAIDWQPQNDNQISFKGSEENDIFLAYTEKMKEMSPKLIMLKDSLKAKPNDPNTMAALEELMKKIERHEEDILAKCRNCLTQIYIMANKEMKFPASLISSQTKRAQYYEYRKNHYFDEVDIKKHELFYSPFLHIKLDDYIFNVVMQTPDTLIAALDEILSKISPNKEAYQHYVDYYVVYFSRMKSRGHDKIFIHLIDNYYINGNAWWINEEMKERMIREAAPFRNLLIGAQMPDFKTFKEDGTAVSLYSIQSEYTIIFLWDPTCSNCKKAIPFLKDYFDKYGNQHDASILSICNKGHDKYNLCWSYLKNGAMEGFINTGDKDQGFRDVLKTTGVPRVFILDKNKIILEKEFNPEYLDSFMKRFTAKTE